MKFKTETIMINILSGFAVVLLAFVTAALIVNGPFVL